MTTENNDNINKQPDVIADYASEIQQIQMEGYELAVRKARRALYWSAAIIFVWEMIAMMRDEFDIIGFAFIVIISGTFVALALWTKKKPYTAIITGICVFFGYIGLLVVANGLVDGSVGVLKALWSGIIIKVAILVNLFLPLKDAKELQEAKKQNF